MMSHGALNDFWSVLPDRRESTWHAMVLRSAVVSAVPHAAKRRPWGGGECAPCGKGRGNPLFFFFMYIIELSYLGCHSVFWERHKKINSFFHPLYLLSSSFPLILIKKKTLVSLFYTLHINNILVKDILASLVWHLLFFFSQSMPKRFPFSHSTKAYVVCVCKKENEIGTYIDRPM